jgi:high-affinity iron transporter
LRSDRRRQAAAVTAYLRTEPAAVAERGGSSLPIAREKLRQSLAAYESGDRKAARELALAAYLDGFEPVEPMLSARDPALMARVETAMGELRAAIAGGGDPAQVARAHRRPRRFVRRNRAGAGARGGQRRLDLPRRLHHPLREGLEALLIVVAMLAFLRKATGRRWSDRSITAGSARSSPASPPGGRRPLDRGQRRQPRADRRLRLAARRRVLLFVGIWMHGKAQADEWQRYIREKVDQRSAEEIGLVPVLLAFIAVYREVFETILFFAGCRPRAGSERWSRAPRPASLCSP